MIDHGVLLKILCDNSREEIGGSVSANMFFMNMLELIVNGFATLDIPEQDKENASAEFKAISDFCENNGIHPFLTLAKMLSAFPKYKEGFSDSISFNKAMSMLEIVHKDDEHYLLTAAEVGAKLLKDPTSFITANIVPPPIAGENGKEGASGEKTEVDTDAFTEFIKSIADTDDEEDKTEKDKKKTEPEFLALPGLVKKVEEVRKALSSAVYGQDHAISSFLSGYFQGELASYSQTNRLKPRATFLFAGPPGVGKTFLAEQAALALGLPFKRFDMSEYCDKEANIEFCGSDKVYKNGQEGNVTKFVSENPHSVLLFDEVEKAHINVIYLFLQLLDAGRLRDNYTDEEVSFTDTIIIFTTNVGKQLYEDETVKLSTVSRKTVLKALSAELNPLTGAPLFPAAICSRFASGNVVMFNHMGVDNLLKVSSQEIEKQAQGISELTKVKIAIDEKIPYAILFSEGANADARTIKGKSCNLVYQELYELYRLLNSESKRCDMDAVKEIEFTVEIPKDKEVAKFYQMETRPSVLIFAAQNVCNAVKDRLSGCDTYVAATLEEAKKLLKENSIDCALCDVLYGGERGEDLLNVDDVISLGREFLDYCVTTTNVPIYILKGDYAISAEEISSLMQSGASGVIGVNEELGAVVQRESVCAYQKKCLAELARANKILKYKTSQKISEDGERATITFFDIKKETAVDAGDNEGMVNAVSRPDLRFSDVIGAKDAKEELSYFVEYLKNPSKISKLGVGVPKGVLLYGPPGTGKTMLAKAMAGESDVTFIRAEGNQFLKRFVGEGAESVHKLFKTARKYAPSILFIDEIDAIARERGASSASENSSDVLTAFLTEMDGFISDETKPVFVLAATNYSVERGNSKSLDEALLRRFDRRIYMDLPDKDERLQYINKRISKIKNHSLTAEQIENIAVRSTGASLASLESVFSLALRNVIKSKGYTLTDKILEEAFETFNNGEVKQWNKDELLRTARHEAGHALMCWVGGEKPTYLTIIARGDHGGYMQHASNEDKGVYTQGDLINRIRTALGGRAAELVYYGNDFGVSTGASGDLQTATSIARAMICSYGMDAEFGLGYIDLNGAVGSDVYVRVINRVNEILKTEMDFAVKTLTEHKAELDGLVNALTAKNALKSDEIEDILKEVKI